MTNEEIRLRKSDKRKKHWKSWGPYLSARAWGTVREDYSATERPGITFRTIMRDHARIDGMKTELPVSVIVTRTFCFALTMWNEKDPILKERLFGLTGTEGNHGEDVKEYYYCVDNPPTHSYMKYLYKYPRRRSPTRTCSSGTAIGQKNGMRVRVGRYRCLSGQSLFRCFYRIR